jgi:hypothetical protein
MGRSLLGRQPWPAVLRDGDKAEKDCRRERRHGPGDSRAVKTQRRPKPECTGQGGRGAGAGGGDAETQSPARVEAGFDPRAMRVMLGSRTLTCNFFFLYGTGI